MEPLGKVNNRVRSTQVVISTAAFLNCHAPRTDLPTDDTPAFRFLPLSHLSWRALSPKDIPTSLQPQPIFLSWAYTLLQLLPVDACPFLLVTAISSHGHWSLLAAAAELLTRGESIVLHSLWKKNGCTNMLLFWASELRSVKQKKILEV